MILCFYPSELLERQKYSGNVASSEEQRGKPFHSNAGFPFPSAVDTLDQERLCCGRREGWALRGVERQPWPLPRTCLSWPGRRG